MDVQEVQKWLTDYRQAWVDRDPDAAAALFTEDSKYREEPYADAVPRRRGRARLLDAGHRDPVRHPDGLGHAGGRRRSHGGRVVGPDDERRHAGHPGRVDDAPVRRTTAVAASFASTGTSRRSTRRRRRAGARSARRRRRLGPSGPGRRRGAARRGRRPGDVRLLSRTPDGSPISRRAAPTSGSPTSTIPPRCRRPWPAGGACCSSAPTRSIGASPSTGLRSTPRCRPGWGT